LDRMNTATVAKPIPADKPLRSLGIRSRRDLIRYYNALTDEEKKQVVLSHFLIVSSTCDLDTQSAIDIVEKLQHGEYPTDDEFLELIYTTTETIQDMKKAYGSLH
jgi:hypothetical protein